MKAVRVISIVLAVVLLAVAVIPFATASAAATSAPKASTIPATRALSDAVMGLPLLAPMSIASPMMSVNIQNSASYKNYGCTYLYQTPNDWIKMDPRQGFDMKWVVQNTGSLVWNPGATILKYLGGAKFSTNGNKFSLSKRVGRGSTVALVVDMAAPKQPGTYSTTWGLASGNKVFCWVDMTLTVIR